MAAVAAARVSAQTNDAGATPERQARQTPAEVLALKARDNVTNWVYLARIYIVIALAIAGAVWVDQTAMADTIAWWWSIPATLAAIVVIGASQHQFGGAIHEGTHHILFANRTLNELASDWLAAFPILTTTYPLPAAPSGASPVRQRSRTRSRHQPAARERPLAGFPDHARRDAVGALEAAVAPQPVPLHDHAGPLQLARRRPQPLCRS